MRAKSFPVKQNSFCNKWDHINWGDSRSSFLKLATIFTLWNTIISILTYWHRQQMYTVELSQNQLFVLSLPHFDVTTKQLHRCSNWILFIPNVDAVRRGVNFIQHLRYFLCDLLKMAEGKGHLGTGSVAKLRLRSVSSRVPVKMSEQAGRERSGGPETNWQNSRLSAT